MKRIFSLLCAASIAIAATSNAAGQTRVKKTDAEIDTLIAACYSGLTDERCAQLGNSVKAVAWDRTDQLYDIFQGAASANERAFAASLFVGDGIVPSTLSTVNTGALRITSVTLDAAEIKAALAGGATGNVPAFTIPARAVLLGYIMRIPTMEAGGSVSSITAHVRTGDVDWSEPREALSPDPVILHHELDLELPYFFADELGWDAPAPATVRVVITGGDSDDLTSATVELRVFYIVLP